MGTPGKIRIIFAIFFVGFLVSANAKFDPPRATLTAPVQFPSSIDGFIKVALKNNPAIQAAQANVIAASARQQASARPLYNPELTGEAQNAIEDTYSAGISQTLDWANKRRARAAVGAADLQVAEAQLISLRQQLAAELLSALAAYQANQQILILAKRRTQLLQQFASLTQKRHASGDVARVDVDLSQLALSESLAQQADAEMNLNQALQSLRSITGLKQAHWPTFPRILPSLHVSDGEIEHLLYQTPLLQILNHQYMSAEARLHLSAKQRHPDPTIGVQGGYSKDGEQSRRLIGMTLSLPLYVRNSYRAEINAANADLIEVDQKRLNLIRQTRAEIESSAERYQTLYQATQQWERVSAKPLSDGMTLIGRLWKAGEINTTEYLVQLKQRVDSQIAGAELKGRTWQAWVNWLKVSGQSECGVHNSSK